jgi:uncharacterized protein (TIGR00369 family)
MTENVQTKHALVVDDDGVFVEQFTRILKRLGYEVSEARDGMAALELCRMKQFEVAIIDIRMPRLNGISFVNNVRRMSPGALSKVIFVTSLDDATLRQDAKSAGGSVFLVKPVTADAVIAAVTGNAFAHERRMVSDTAVPASALDAVRDSFTRQGIMATLGATLAKVDQGTCEITLPYRAALSQQHGFFHAGVVSTIADSAAGYAAFSLFPAGSSVLTVEFKINLLAPADGEILRATGRVIKQGRTLTICEMQAFITKNGEEKLCAHGTSTLMCLKDSSSLQAG